MEVLFLFIILLCLQTGRSQYFQLFHDGSYDFNYHTNDDQHRTEVGYADGTVLGKYAYVTPVGEKIDVEYSAGKDGYQENRKVSKAGINKGYQYRMKIQTHQPFLHFGNAQFPSSDQQTQLSNSGKKLLMFKSNFENTENSENSENSHFNRNSNQQLQNIRNYPSDDMDFDSNLNAERNIEQLKLTTNKPEELLWIPSPINKPRMPPTPIWMKPSTTEDYNQMLTSTTNKPMFEESIKKIPNSGFILRQPLRRPAAVASTTISTTTETPVDDDSPCLNMASTTPLKNVTKVFVKTMGSSGIVNVKPFEIITRRMLRDNHGVNGYLALSSRLRTVMRSPKQNFQFLPLSGFSVIPEQLENENKELLNQNNQQQLIQNQQFGQNNQPLSQSLQFGQNNQLLNQNNSQFGQSNQQFGLNNQQFGQSNQQFGQSNQQFGQSDQQFGQSNQQFGQSNQQFGRLNPNMNMNQFQENNPQHVTSSVLVIHDRPRSQPQSNIGILPFPATGPIDRNTFNSKFQGPISPQFGVNGLPAYPLELINAGVAQPRMDY